MVTATGCACFFSSLPLLVLLRVLLLVLRLLRALNSRQLVTICWQRYQISAIRAEMMEEDERAVALRRDMPHLKGGEERRGGKQPCGKQEAGRPGDVAV